MNLLSSPQQWHRGPQNKLHRAANDGSTERVLALLSTGSINIDHGDPVGMTPLMIASLNGYSRIVGILLEKGANVSIVDGDGRTALHEAAQGGHLAVSKVLVKAGADLEAAISSTGSTPLHLAAMNGHSEVVSALIEAGANLNSRRLDRSTPLYVAAFEGRVGVVKVLLRAKADPLITRANPAGGHFVPLGAAAQNGHLEVVRELIRQVGIEGCGGPSGGVDALRLAGQAQHVDIMAALTDAGVVDTGFALLMAAGLGREASVKFLLRQPAGRYHVNAVDRSGRTALICCMAFGGFSSPSGDFRSPSSRIARLLIDAGADATSSVRLVDRAWRVLYDDTPLGFATRMLREKKVGADDARKDQLHQLEAIRRLLLRVEAVHAVSWLWTNDVASDNPGALVRGAKRKAQKTTSTAVAMMLPILRQRARRRVPLMATILRFAMA